MERFQCLDCYYRFSAEGIIPCPDCGSTNITIYVGDRVQLLTVGVDEVLESVFFQPDDKLTYRVTTNIPKNCKLRGVQFDLGRNSFDILLEHPSFEMVPTGCEPRHIVREVKLVNLSIKEQ